MSSQCRVAGDHRAAVAECAEIFAGIKTEAAHVAHRAAQPALVSRAVRLGGVLHNEQLPFLCDLQQRVHVRRMAVKMHRHDGFGARRQGAFHRLHIQGGIVRLAIHQDGARPGLGDGQHTRDEGVGRDNHLITRANAEGEQGEMQRIRAVRHPDAKGNLVERREFLFEFAHVFAEDEIAAARRAQQGGVQLGFEVLILPDQVNELDFGCSHKIKFKSRKQKAES